MEEVSNTLQAARDAYAACHWARARDAFAAAHEQEPLAADDLFALADAAWWLGDTAESLARSEEAYRLYLQGEKPRRAAMAAITIAVNLFLRGDDVVGSGWIGRAQRLLADDPESAEAGYLRYVLDVEAGFGGVEPGAVAASARRVGEIGRRHRDPNLIALGILGEGRALVRDGRLEEGLTLLDEAMLATLAEDLDPAWAGNLYCNLMAACHEVADVRRAVAWTEATTRWLETLPAAVLFTGICRVHRSQVLQITGVWDLAEREAVRVCEDLADISVASAAEAHYQVGELRRLRGDLAGAEDAYSHAHRLGREPQPGIALLRLAQGRVDEASASIRTALAGTADDPPLRFRLCAAAVEVALAAGDLDGARRAHGEVGAIAATYRSSGFEATARQTLGAILLGEGRAEESLPVLRDACQRWRDLNAPYETARVGTLLARACAALGDADAASRELDAAAAVFERLGADPERAGVEALRGRSALPGGLTAREAEVLRHVAAGRTNRQIAAALVISEKTVARHLSNIFTKLGVPSRTAAAAFAFARGLAARPHGQDDPSARAGSLRSPADDRSPRPS